MLQTLIEPVNAITGKPYAGGNVQKLIDAMDSDSRFITGAFATFKQWLSVGRCVRKGESCAARLLAFSDRNTQEADGTATEKGKASFKKGFCVFALEQTDAIEGWTPDQAQPGANDEETEAPAKEDQPTPGKLYSLSALATTGAWAKSEVSAKPTPTVSSDKLLIKAQALLDKAEACFADRLQNTPKRIAQSMHKRMEGQRMERQAHILKAYATAIDDGEAPLVGCTVRQIITWADEASIYTCKPVSNGYHGYHVETTDAKHNEAHHITLRNLLDPRKVMESAEKVAKEQAEAELRNCDVEGFFPTPSTVIRVMLEQAGDMWDKTVLEPSAGKGDLVQAALKAGAKSVKAFEIAPRLADYVGRFVRPVGSTQCVVAHQADFMGQLPVGDHARVDVVLMNPPFERDAAPAHVLHALSWLKPGGRLVSVMPSNWAEKKAADYLLRTIDDRGLSMTEIEIDGPAFNGANSFRQTAVRTSIIVIG